MGLFGNLTRKDESVLDIINKTHPSKKSSNIKIKKGSLSSNINNITERVNEIMGSLAKNYLLIKSDVDFINYCKKVATCDYVAIDTETSGLEYSDQHNLAGICIQGYGMKAAYAPVGHINPVTELLLSEQVSHEAVTKGMQIIKDSKVKVIFHSAYYDIVVLYLATGIWLDVYFDTVLAAFNLNENENHSLKVLYDKYCTNDKGVHKFSELFEGIDIRYLPPSTVFCYGAHDAEMTNALYRFQIPYLTANNILCKKHDLIGASKLLFTIDIPLVRILAEMRVNGINIDYNKADELYSKYDKIRIEQEERFNLVTHFIKFGLVDMCFEDFIVKYYHQIDDNTYVYVKDIKHLVKWTLSNLKEIYKAVVKPHTLSYPLNYNSSAQLQKLTYNILGYGTIFRKKPKGVGDEVIQVVLNESKYKGTVLYQIFGVLSSVKKYDKLLNNFIVKYVEIAKDYGGKIHCKFSGLGTKTSRTSSSAPNLQQVPAKGDTSDIRNMFVPEEGHIFISCDYSQQEMMAVASISKDKKLIELFRQGGDIYSRIASIAFNLPYESCLEHLPNGKTSKEGKKIRSKAKTIALGIVYGKGIKAISEELFVSIDKAQEIKDSVLKTFPDLARYLRDVITYVKKTNYVKDFYGRKRRLPDINLPDFTFKFPDSFNKNTCEFYKSQYLSKLHKVPFRDKKDVIREAKMHDIIITDNGANIAKAQREAYNSPVQSTAACITKQAMMNIYNNKRLRELGVKICLTIHDENIVDVPIEYADECAKIINQCSIDAGRGLNLKLRCDVEMTKCWGGKKIE